MEMDTAKAQVAMEMGFERALIFFALKKRCFTDAGDLINYLNDVMLSCKYPEAKHLFHYFLSEDDKRVLQEIRLNPEEMECEINIEIRRKKLHRLQQEREEKQLWIEANKLNDLKYLEQRTSNEYSEKKKDMLKRMNAMRDEIRKIEEEKERKLAKMTAMERLLTETAQLMYDTKCKKCFKGQRCVLLLPCTHLTLCLDCRYVSRTCPMCNTPISNTIQTYIS